MESLNQKLQKLSFPLSHSQSYELFYLLAQQPKLTKDNISDIINVFVYYDNNFSFNDIIEAYKPSENTILNQCVANKHIGMLSFFQEQKTVFPHENSMTLMDCFYMANTREGKNNDNVDIKKYLTTLDAISKRIICQENNNSAHYKEMVYLFGKFNLNNLAGYSFYAHLLQYTKSDLCKDHLTQYFGSFHLNNYSLKHIKTLIKPFIKDKILRNDFPLEIFLRRSSELNPTELQKFIGSQMGNLIINQNIKAVFSFLTKNKNSSFLSKNYDTPIIKKQMDFLHTTLSALSHENKEKLCQSDNFNLIQQFALNTENYSLVSLMLAMDFKYANINNDHSHYCSEENYIHHYITDRNRLFITEDCISEEIKSLFSHKRTVREDIKLYILPEEKLSNISEFPSEILSLIFFTVDSVNKTALNFFKDKNPLVQAIKNNCLPEIENELHKIIYEPSYIKNSYIENDLYQAYYESYAKFLLELEDIFLNDFSVEIPHSLYANMIGECYDKEINEGSEYINPVIMAEFQKKLIAEHLDTNDKHLAKPHRL